MHIYFLEQTNEIFAAYKKVMKKINQTSGLLNENDAMTFLFNKAQQFIYKNKEINIFVVF